MQMKALLASATVLGLFALAPSANAATVLLKNTQVSWDKSATVGGSNVNTSGNGTSSAKIKWGSPANQPQSAYQFQRASNSIAFNLPPSPTPSQKIGTFTHFNEPINVGSSITSTQLKLTTNIFIDGTDFGWKTFLFDFSHDETLNSGKNNCCADIVTFNTSNLSESFLYGGYEYTLTLTGFGNSANNLVSAFSSKEGGKNKVGLWGYVTQTSAIPEPATWAMMIAGFGMIGAQMRRRNRMAVSA